MANLSQQKRERMLEFLNQLKSEHTDDASLIALNEIENALISKKYGLVWEQHEEQVDVMMRDNVPVFTEVPEKEIKGDPDSEQYNFLLEGDNLHSLKLLEKTHRGRIDVIYIDPPYNTGNKDFIYDDTFIDADDSYKHSKWLSFMAERLSILKNLLSKTGLIFISIGEQELSSLKLLCDEIFGERNYITIFSRQMKSGGAKGKYYTPNIDYVLTYSKNIDELPNFKAILTQKQIDTFYNKTETEGTRKGELYGEERLFKASLEARPNQRYYIQCPDGSFAIPPGETFPEKLEDGCAVLPKSTDKVWKWIYSRYQKELAQGNIIFKKTKTSGLVDENGNQSKWNIYNKLWLSEQQEKGVVPSNFIQEYENRQSAAEMKNLGLNFTYAKPVDLIKYLITIANQRDDILILDCFAGSGTTGQAVLELNAEDKGDRHFILCTNNENNICEEVTYPRLKIISEGYRDRKKKVKPALEFNLKYYKTDFIPKVSDKEDYSVTDELLKHIKEMIQLENGINVDGENYLIILTDDEADELEKHPNIVEKCKGIYISNDVFLTSSQEKIFSGVCLKQIPDYYFEDELREVHEIW